jgi:hypothetical protein
MRSQIGPAPQDDPALILRRLCSSCLPSWFLSLCTLASNKHNEKTPEELDQEKQDQAEDAKNWTLPSAWIESLLSMTHYLYVIAGPGVFVSTFFQES